jgi:F0F1-type ATP synthase epsilon subunit
VDTETKKVCSIERISFTSILGAHEILPMHESLVTELVPCNVTFSSEGGEADSILLNEGGLLIFQDGICDIWAF